MKTIKFYLPIVFFSLLFCVGVSLRFIRTCDIGASGDDSAFYWQMAYDWMSGDKILSEHFRPFIYWLNAKVMGLTGPNDWILRLANGIYDSLAAALMVASAWLLRRNLLLGLASASAYLFLYYPLTVTRTELVHAPSTFFVTLSLTCLLAWLNKQQNYWLFLCGLFEGMAWLIHPDLAVLGASATFVLFYKNIVSSRIHSEDIWKKISRDFLLYLAGYFLIFFIFMWDLGFSDLMENFFINFKTQSKSLRETFLWRLYHFSEIYLKETAGVYVIILLGLSSGLLIYKKILNRITSHDLALISFPVGFLFFCSLLFAQNVLPRLLLPMIPALILFIFVQFYDVFSQKKFQSLVVALLSLSIIYANFESTRYPFNEQETIYKQLNAHFSPFIKKESKFLITPISTLHIHSVLEKKMYLNGSGVYLVATNYSSIAEAVEKEKITHVWIADVLKDLRIFGINLKLTYVERLKTLFGMTPENYDRDKEIMIIKQFLKSQNATLVDKSKFGELYELK